MRNTANKLQLRHKHFILQLLACGYKARRIAKDVQAEFDISITPGAVHHYIDNYKEDIKALNEQINAEIRLAVPIANRIVRLKALQKALDKAEHEEDYKLIPSIVAQAQKEAGDDRIMFELHDKRERKPAITLDQAEQLRLLESGDQKYEFAVPHVSDPDRSRTYIIGRERNSEKQSAEMRKFEAKGECGNAEIRDAEFSDV